jgi:hypothetical protein
VSHACSLSNIPLGAGPGSGDWCYRADLALARRMPNIAGSKEESEAFDSN